MVTVPAGKPPVPPEQGLYVAATAQPPQMFSLLWHLTSFDESATMYTMPRALNPCSQTESRGSHSWLMLQVSAQWLLQRRGAVPPSSSGRLPCPRCSLDGRCVVLRCVITHGVYTPVSKSPPPFFLFVGPGAEPGVLSTVDKPSRPPSNLSG